MDIYLYDDILPGAAARFLKELRSAKDVTVHINSPGGDVGEGLAINNTLLNHPHAVTTLVEGFALSIASLIAMGGRRVVMAANAMLMIHDPWTPQGGNAEELQRNAAGLDRIAEGMAVSYQRQGRTKLSAQEIRRLMKAETWFTAKQALDLGLIDEIMEPLKMAACSRFDLSRFHNVPTEVHSMNPSNGLNPSNTNHSHNAAASSSQNSAAQSSLSPSAAEIRAEVILGEKKRQDTIRVLFSSMNGNGWSQSATGGENATQAAIKALQAQCLSDPDCTPQDAQRCFGALFNGLRMGVGSEPLTPGVLAAQDAHHISAGNDGMSDFVAAATDALLERAGFRLKKAHPGARDLARMSIVGMAEAIVSKAGVRTRDRNPGSILKAAHTTSDFPFLLANTANKALMLGYENEPASHRMWVRTVEVMDFKQQSRIARSEAPALLQVNEGGEFTHGTFGERREAYQLATWGRIFAMTRQAMVNDDLGAFTDLPKSFGASAARLEADKVYAILTGNPQMSDSVALFNSAHGNLASSGVALGVQSLGAARAAMRKQKGLSNLGFLNIVPAYLIVPAALETSAESLLNSLTRPDAMAAGVDNPQWIRSLSLVVDARLDAASETAWYLAGSTAQVDTVEIAYLQGQRGVFTEEENDFDKDSFKLKARLDFQAAAIDWRGLYKNPGAAPA